MTDYYLNNNFIYHQILDQEILSNNKLNIN